MKLIIVGGVAGGMSCAARARRLDEAAEITVLERGAYVSFANCGLPYFVGGEITEESSLLLHTPDTLKATLNLDVRVNTEVTSIDPQAHTVTVQTPDGTEVLSYDTLVLSPGSVSAAPPIPGIDSPRVHTLRTVDDARRLKELASGGTAVVLGAGFIGLEAAEAFINRGLETHIVELTDHVLPPLEQDLAWHVERELERLGAHIHTGVAATSITLETDRDEITLADGTVIPADIIVLAAGARPDTALAEHAGIEVQGGILIDEYGQTSAPDIYAVGDATVSTHQVTNASQVVALAGPANRAGRYVAENIMTGETRALPPLLGTAIVRVGSLTAAMTGANARALDAAGMEYTTLHLHPAQHAGYYPGATPMHIVVHIGPDGRILGAQGVGADGIDKRIDVLATAMKAGMAATDLIDLDLSYSPPYGSAKDAVNLIGMVADNVLSGKLRLAYPADLTGTDTVLDVRSREEFAAGHVPGAINIPHTELRDRLDELDDSPLIVMCAAGVRSWIGYNIVTQAGLKARMLSGGVATLLASDHESIWEER